jgi:autotransporter translocation and assembly factor TamB
MIVKMRWALGIAFIVLLAGACLAAWYLNTGAFQETARSMLISRIEKATGMRARIDRAAFDIFRGRFEIDGLELTPPASASGLSTLRAEKIRAALSVSSFWRLRVRLDELYILRPQVELVAGGGSGWNPEETLKTVKLSLRLEAAKVLVSEGRFRINEYTAPFHLQLEDLDCEIRYSDRLPSYRIRLDYKRSRIYYRRRDIVHDLAAQADLSAQGIEIESFDFRHGRSRLQGHASVRGWNAPVLLVHAAGTVGAEDLVLAHPSLKEGDGTIQIETDLRRDAKGIHAEGRFSASRGGYRRMNFRDLSGDYEIAEDVLHFREVTGRIGKGRFRVRGDIQLREKSPSGHRVDIEATGVPLLEAGRVLHLPLNSFENAVDATAALQWNRGEEDFRADCNVTLHGLPDSPETAARGTLLGGKAQFTVWGNGAVHLASANLSSLRTTVQAHGGQASVFHVQLSTTRAAEPLNLLARFSPGVADLLTRQADLRDIEGSYELGGEVRIPSPAGVEYHGSFSVQNGRWRSYKLDSMSALASLDSGGLRLRSLSAQLGPQTVEGELDLRFAEAGQLTDFRFLGALRNIALDSLKHLGVDAPGISGTLNGSGSIRYARGAWEGRGDVVVREGRFRGERFDVVQARLRVEDGRLHLTDAEVIRDAARLSARGYMDLQSKRLDMTAALEGLSLEQIPAVRERGLPIQGRFQARGKIGGTLGNPSFTGTFDLDSLRYSSWNLGRGKGSVEFERGVLRGRAGIQSKFGSLNVEANISADAGFPGKAALEFENLDLQRIFTGRTPFYLEELSSALKGRLEAEGKFDNPAALKMRGELDGARFKILDYELHNAERIQFTVQNRTFRAENVRFVGEGTQLALSGTVPLDESARLDLNLTGTLNLRLLEGLEKKLRTIGTADLDIRASGARKNPQFIGRVRLRDAGFEHQDLAFRLSALQGDIVFSRNLIRLENVRGAAANGTLELSGVLEHENAVLRSINVGVSARNARVLYPRDFRSVVNAELRLSGNRELQILSGDVEVLRSEYVRSFNLLGPLGGRGVVPSGPLTANPALMGLRLNIELRSDNGLVIDNELAKLRAGLRLSLRGTPAYPSLTGRVEVGEGAIFFRGNRFEITRATADFVDRNRINPVLEIRAEADVKSYRLILDVVGDLDHLNMNITSDPPMSTVDILTLLTTGFEREAVAETARSQSQMVGMTAASVLSENLTGAIGKRVERVFGLESFRVDPFIAGVESDPTARVTISERLSKDLVVTYSRSLTTSQDQIVVIEYAIGRDVSIVATRDENGKYGLDFRIRKRFR